MFRKLETESSRLARRRRFVDSTTRRIVGLGGAAVVAAIALIFFFLVWVAAPLLQGANIERLPDASMPSSGVLALGVDDSLESLHAIDAAGVVYFLDPETAAVLETRSLPGGALAAARRVHPTGDTYALLAPDGRTAFVRLRSRVRFSGAAGPEARRVEPVVETLDGGRALGFATPYGTPFDAHRDDFGLHVAAVDGAGTIRLSAIEHLDGGRTGGKAREGRIEPGRAVAQIDFGPRGTALHVTGTDGAMTVYDVSVPEFPRPALSARLVSPGDAMTVVAPLLGRLSFLVADSRGGLTQWFPTPSGEGRRLVAARTFTFPAPVALLVTEARRKGFLALDSTGALHLAHTTSERRLATLEHALEEAASDVRLGVFSPRSDRAYLLSSDGVLHRYAVTNPHPEVSFAALWQDVHYEGYEKPVRSWQSSSAETDFEPKFSLAPLLFGTLKAAFYAMLFAAPIAVMSAVYTAYFMAPAMRRWVKPGIEVMAALPTVILGFLAGLWLAPLVEAHLSATLLTFLAVPAGVLLFAWAWRALPTRMTRPLDGWAAVLTVPVIVGVVWAVFLFDAQLEAALFDGDAQRWARSVLGLAYDQRNALVVGIAMGLAVIPTIFAISEDAIHGVPRHLSTGSLALGATAWQTVTKVVIPTASPGIFSASMIGFGRGVGETMIVLMATGNTPLMDFNLFEGMRTLAANIAMELPESEVGSTHYRILFLSALVLFVITFSFNTAAEVVRQRLRVRYGNL